MFHEAGLLHGYLVVGALLFGLGLVGFLARRNMIVMFLSVEMMLQGVSLSLVGWSRFHNDWGGQVFVLFIIAVAAGEAAILMALVLMLFQRTGRLDVVDWQSLREANQPAFVDRPPPQFDDEDRPPDWPRQTPAGVAPRIDPDELAYRSHV